MNASTASPRAGWRRATLPAAGVLLALLVAAASLAGSRNPSSLSAFAESGPGTYALTIRASQTNDTIIAVPLNDPSQALPVTTVDHLPGFTTTGSISPDGLKAALIVIDGGSLTRPAGTLVFVDLTTGEKTPALGGLDPLQIPPWDAGSSFVGVTRTATSADGGPVALVLRVQIGGSIEAAGEFAGASGAFPFAVDSEGAIVSCVIAGDGSTVYRNSAPSIHLGPYITRDWSLSPDGSAVAYIEVNTDSGIKYYSRTSGPGLSNVTQGLSLAGPQSLGSAWRPGSDSATFGFDPSTALTAAQSGFDVPVSYSRSGSALAVEHWSGTSYEQPGTLKLEAVSQAGRVSLEPATRFLGWSER